MLQVSEAKPTGIAVELLGFELKKAEAEARQRSEKAAADQSACFAFFPLSRLPQNFVDESDLTNPKENIENCCRNFVEICHIISPKFWQKGTLHVLQMEI